MSRPEHLAPPEIIYNEDGATKYMRNTRMKRIQTKLSMRAIELMRLPADESCLVLDVGCGAGLSGGALETMGHRFIGTDISRNMINCAMQEDVDGDMLQHDMGLGLPFRPGSFDGAISISAVQWLCNADRSEHIPKLRMKKFFSSLYMVLRRGARAVLQFYPENRHQSNMIVHFATKAGFSGGLVVDYPHSTRAKKFYLVLFAGPQSDYVPKAKLGDPNDSEDEAMFDSDEEEDEEDEEFEEDEEDDGLYEQSVAETVTHSKKRKVHLSESAKKGKQTNKRRKLEKHSKGWIMAKKVQQEKKGNKTRPNTKYTGRRRGPKF